MRLEWWGGLRRALGQATEPQAITGRSSVVALILLSQDLRLQLCA